MSVSTLSITGGAAVHVEAMGTVETTTGPLNIGTSATSGALTADGLGTMVSAISGSGGSWGTSGGQALVIFRNGAEGNFGTLNIASGTAVGTLAVVDVLSGAELNTGRISAAAAGGSTTSATINVQGAGSSVIQSGTFPTTIGHASSGAAIINVGTTGSGASFTNENGAITINQTGTLSIGSAATTGTFDAGKPMTVKGLVNLGGGTMFVRDTLTIDPAGDFNFTGGTLHAVNIVGSLENNGGTLEPGFSIATLTINGDYTQSATSKLLFELGASLNDFDKLQPTGTAMLDGVLEVELGSFLPQLGETFEIITAGLGVSGTFANEMLPSLGGGLDWDVIYDYDFNSVTLEVVEAGLLGDDNGDNTVDAADYVAWRKNSGTEDAYNLWHEHFGETPDTASAATEAVHSAVPEPTALALLVLASIGITRRAR